MISVDGKTMFGFSMAELIQMPGEQLDALYNNTRKAFGPLGAGMPTSADVNAMIERMNAEDSEEQTGKNATPARSTKPTTIPTHNEAKPAERADESQAATAGEGGPLPIMSIVRKTTQRLDGRDADATRDGHLGVPALTPAENVLFEALAAIEHDRWGDWQSYVHGSCTRNPDGSLTIPAKLAARWDRQIETRYEDLSPIERNSDRDQVLRYWDLVKAAAATFEAKTGDRS